MADSKIDNLAELPSASFASADWLVVFDTSTGTTKKLAPSDLLGLVTGTFAAGDILYHNGTSFVKLTKGTAEQVLAMNSGATAPEWADTPGGMAHIETQDLSSDSVANFTGFDASSYLGYEFVFQNVLPDSNNRSFYMRTSSDGGTSYDSGGSDYEWMEFGNTTVTSTSRLDLTDTLGMDADADMGLSGKLQLFAPHKAKYTHAHWQVSFYQEALRVRNGGGYRVSAADVDAVRFYFSSGNIAEGTISMYGLKSS